MPVCLHSKDLWRALLSLHSGPRYPRISVSGDGPVLNPFYRTSSPTYSRPNLRYPRVSVSGDGPALNPFYRASSPTYSSPNLRYLRNLFLSVRPSGHRLFSFSRNPSGATTHEDQVSTYRPAATPLPRRGAGRRRDDPDVNERQVSDEKESPRKGVIRLPDEVLLGCLGFCIST